MVAINFANAFDVLETVSGIPNKKWLSQHQSGELKRIILAEGTLTRPIITKMNKAFGKAETYTDHNGIQYAWDLSDGNRVTGYARWSGEHELGYIKFK
jgi:hypothetical protein